MSCYYIYFKVGGTSADGSYTAHCRSHSVNGLTFTYSSDDAVTCTFDDATKSKYTADELTLSTEDFLLDTATEGGNTTVTATELS